MSEVLWLCFAVAAAIAGMGWLALSMDVHWRQVAKVDVAPASSTVTTLRLAGVSALALSLLFCLRADNASMAVLVWVMLLTASAVCIAMMLTRRAEALNLLLLRRFNFRRSAA